MTSGMLLLMASKSASKQQRAGRRRIGGSRAGGDKSSSRLFHVAAHWPRGLLAPAGKAFADAGAAPRHRPLDGPAKRSFARRPGHRHCGSGGSPAEECGSQAGCPRNLPRLHGRVTAFGGPCPTSLTGAATASTLCSRRVRAVEAAPEQRDDPLDPEQKAREQIDRQLGQAGWAVQNHRQLNISAG